MAVTQYIGARYVPKFYENSDGTEEWRSGVEYEPLTIVTYNGNSYTSKKPVPSNIGNPSENTAYWVSTGNYNAQVEILRQEVNELREDVMGSFAWTLGQDCTSPEEFGAVGDGVTDDSEAIQNAINSGKPVIAFKNYYITQRITIPYNATAFFLGKITATGDGFYFNSTDATLYCKSIEGNDTGYAVLIEDPGVDQEIGVTTRNNIQVDYINHFLYGFYLYAHNTNKGIQMNKLWWNRMLNVNTCIRMRAEHTHTWVNQNQFYGGVFGGTTTQGIVYGVYAVSDSDAEISSNNFYDVIFEGLSGHLVHMEYCMGNTFNGSRIAESNTGSTFIHFYASGCNKFVGGYLAFNQNKIEDIKNTGWANNLAYRYRNSYEFFNMLFGTDSWGGQLTAYSFNNCITTDQGGCARNIQYDARNADLDLSERVTTVNWFTCPGFSFLIGGGHTITLPCMFRSVIGHMFLYVTDNTQVTIKDCDGVTRRTITAGGQYIVYAISADEVRVVKCD